LENIRRRSVRVPKLHRGFILTKKGDINPRKKSETPLAPWGGIFRFFCGKFQKLSYGSETLNMTSEGLGEMFEGDSADTCAVKFPLTSMGG
jgi:hypothetical protein